MTIDYLLVETTCAGERRLDIRPEGIWYERKKIEKFSTQFPAL
jgi:hypothetical protein